MTWEYALIGLVVGIAIGAVAMRFGNRKLRDQQVMKNELEKSKAELDEYRQELGAILPAALSCSITWRQITVSFISIWRRAPTICCLICQSRIIRSTIA